ncbi:MAG: AAA family ATPase [Candidatus Aenigmarchaeota archaeon]|nr:AAA family ATPase [Candidatus Aenigmarchaeota archaeon]
MNLDMNLSEKYVKLFSWSENPFSFKILPNLFVGYMKETENILDNIRSMDKFSLLLGPTGSGKTTLLKFIADKFDGKSIFYLSKPPKNPEDWVNIFTNFIGFGIMERLFSRRKNLNLYNLSEWVNKKTQRRKIVLLLDEGHEATIETLEWLRTLTDQIDNLSIVIAGLPTLEQILRENLETFIRRVSTKVELTNLTKSETRELIKKRIEWVGGNDIKPFTSETIQVIHEKTGGFPREVIKLCNDFVQKATERNISTIDPNFLEEIRTEAPRRVSLGSINNLPSRQKLILELLNKNKDITPSEVVSNIELDGYRDKENAIRSVNNILKRLLKDGLVTRRRAGKTFQYKLSDKVKTMMVNA